MDCHNKTTDAFNSRNTFRSSDVSSRPCNGHHARCSLGCSRKTAPKVPATELKSHFGSSLKRNHSHSFASDKSNDGLFAGDDAVAEAHSWCRLQTLFVSQTCEFSSFPPPFWRIETLGEQTKKITRKNSDSVDGCECHHCQRETGVPYSLDSLHVPRFRLRES